MISQILLVAFCHLMQCTACSEVQMTNLLIDPLVLQVVRSVSPVQSLFFIISRILLHLEPHGGPLGVLLAVRLLPLALHADAATAATARQARVAGVTVLSPHKGGGEVAVSETALAAQLCLVSSS